MPSIQNIRQYKEYMTGDLYTGVRGQQSIDQSYIDDSFVVSGVKDPHSILRTGIGYQVITAPGEQIVTKNPQAYFATPKKGDESGINKLAKETNEVWIYNQARQIPNPYKESVKNKLARGESYIWVAHNERWVTGKKERYGMPVLFNIPDPMIVYGDPHEDDCGWVPNCGVPNRVVVSYPKQVRDTIAAYPSWSNPLKKDPNSSKEMVDFWCYYDKDVVYFEADGQALLPNGIVRNLYGFVPFIRKYSGFGKSSATGDMTELIVSDLRYSRGLINEYTSLHSDISSILHIFAHKPVTIIQPSNSEIDEVELQRRFNLGSYALNILYLDDPDPSKILMGETPTPDAEVFQHLANIRAEINQRHPFLNAGFPAGSSGRQQDMASLAAMRRYDTVIENTEEEFATAYEMGMKILGRVPTLRPEHISKEDLSRPFKCNIELKAEDPIENDRRATLGSRLYQQQEISLKENLVKYQGYTESEADDIITDILVERVTFNSPDVAELIGLKAAEEAGMADELQMLRARRQQLEGLGNQTGPSEMQQRIGETQTQLGQEMADQGLVNKGARKPPSRYNRGDRFGQQRG